MSEALGTDELVLVIAAGDDWLHAGTVAEVLDHARRHRDGEGHPGGPPTTEPGHERVVDLYDVGGRPLRPVLDDRLEVRGFAPAGVPDEEAVRRRVDGVLDRAQSFLDDHPGGGAAAAWPAMTEVPRPVGSLDEVVAALRRATTGSPRGHSGGWFHNLLHAMGG